MSAASSIRRSAPLSRAEALSLAAALDVQSESPAQEEPGEGAERAFLTFVMIPVEERIGEWRFAGAAGSLGQALFRIADFGAEMGVTQQPRDIALREWLEQEALEVWTDLSGAWSYESLPLAEIGDHDVVLFAEGQAPYDDFGFCVLEITTLTGSPFRGRAPDTTRPKTWSEDDDVTDDDVIDDE